jgi:hypothetical protein
MLRTRMSFILFSVFVAIVLALVGCSSNDCPVCENNQALVQLSAHKVDFGANATSASFVISNSGQGSLAWDLEVAYRPAVAKAAEAQQGEWLTLSNSSGDGDATIFMTADREMLDNIGVHRAVVYVNTPGAANQARDSVEVFILSGSQWVIADDSSYEACWAVDNYDYYWMKEFGLPQGVSGIFVDSVSFNFCEADTVIQLISFDSQYDQTNQVYVPYSVLWSDNQYVPVTQGWNTFPVDWYFNFEPFYIGYFQPGSTVPQPQIDRESDNPARLSWRVRQTNEDFNNPVLTAQAMVGFQTLAFRIYITPRLTYNPKMAAEYRSTDDEARARTLRTGYAYQGNFPASLKPGIAE